MKQQILTGADRIDTYSDLFEGQRIGLITSPTGVLNDLSSTIDKFNDDYTLTALFSPEHGVRGDQQDGEHILSYVDAKTNVKVFSIYGNKRTPTLEELDEIDVLVYDIQDVGSRYYTFIYSMSNAMIVAKKKNIPFVVLDRPNPISGLYPEGSPMTEECVSFVGMYDIPQRYSLTPGELALMLNEKEQINSDLNVVPMKGWKRKYFLDDLELQWINPSPNIASFEAALCYNGTCLFEATNLSEGRGTTRPFEMIGAPWVNSEALAEELNRWALNGVYFRPISFVPQFHKHKGVLCHGVQVHVLDKHKFRPLETGLVMLNVVKKQGGEKFMFTSPRNEVGDFTIDLFYGSNEARKQFFLEKLLETIYVYSAAYEKQYERYWLYE